MMEANLSTPSTRKATGPESLSLMRQLNELGIDFKDLQTSQSSLEEIFVKLVRASMNLYAIRAIYLFEMARTWRTLLQSVVSPVISTSLYFIVFGAAIGSRMTAIDGISYGAFIVPGLIMLSLLTQSISNASFGIFFPKFSGTIYEILSAPVSYIEIVIGYVGAAASKSILLGLIILATARLFVTFEIAHPLWMLAFLILTVRHVQSVRLHHRNLGGWIRETATRASADRDAADVPRRQFLFHRHAAAFLADGHARQSRRLSGQRISLEFLREFRRERRREPRHDHDVSDPLPGGDRADFQDRVQAEILTVPKW